MPRRTGARRRPQPAPELFDRPPAVWRQLGAPPDLYDVDAAAAAELAAHRAVLEPGEAGHRGPEWFYARRWWREHRWRFLASKGQLTAREAVILGRPGRAG
jgi:hypothetical protein